MATESDSLQLKHQGADQEPTQAANQTPEQNEGVITQVSNAASQTASQVSNAASQTASQASTLLQQTGEQVKNIAQGAADVVKNKLGINNDVDNPTPDHNTDSSSAGNNPTTASSAPAAGASNLPTSTAPASNQ